MSLKKWFYRDGHPNRVARTLDRGTAALYALGVAPDYLVALEVRGRRSGRTIALPLVMVVVVGERYLVSMLGQNAITRGTRGGRSFASSGDLWDGT